MDLDRAIANMPGAIALPRKNGELIFSEPWEGRVFAMAIALNDEEAFPWEEFRQRLMAEVNAVDGTSDPAPGYYELWLAAFEQLLLTKGIMTLEEFERRKAEFASGAREEVF
jgi:nitrile hydratase accessory protein